ncbi:MAG TPA: hypothetical protein PKA63_08995 [Oligoflexia bacterium]|nr:hypothetical protein [Oligoflexia bacterium]HMP48788.1 hypothetical protein [Oligoflexia bacterium]
MDKVRSGRGLSDLGSEYGIAPSTISSWLGRSASGKRGDELEISRLGRESEALLKIIGRMTYQEEFKKRKAFLNQ